MDQDCDRVRAWWLAMWLLLLLAAGACDQPKPVGVVLAVQGMTCASCERAIEAKLARIEGVREVRASHVERTVRVTFVPSKVRLDTIITAIRSLGYTAQAPAKSAGR